MKQLLFEIKLGHFLGYWSESKESTLWFDTEALELINTETLKTEFYIYHLCKIQSQCKLMLC